MSDKIIVRDDGFHPAEGQPQVTLSPDIDPRALADHIHHDLVAIDFPTMLDGRGFSLARRLRALGFDGRLRATGALIADQYAMARRVGFNEVEITADLARRQPQQQWLARADWQSWNHRDELAG